MDKQAQYKQIYPKTCSNCALHKLTQRICSIKCCKQAAHKTKLAEKNQHKNKRNPRGSNLQVQKKNKHKFAGELQGCNTDTEEATA